MRPYRVFLALALLGGMALPEAQAQVVVTPRPGGMPAVARPPRMYPYTTGRRHRRRHRRGRVYMPAPAVVRPAF